MGESKVGALLWVREVACGVAHQARNAGTPNPLNSPSNPRANAHQGKTQQSEEEEHKGKQLHGGFWRGVGDCDGKK
jgi:hypothetical protein